MHIENKQSFNSRPAVNQVRFITMAKETISADNSIGFSINHSIIDNVANNISSDYSNNVGCNNVGSYIKFTASDNLEKKLVYLDI